jgi:hypothetical protein
MANTLTGLIPTIYEAADVVSRELTGFIPAVTLNASADAAAKDQTISYPVVGSNSAADIAAAATGPDPADTTFGVGTMSINKARGVTFYWTGEDVKSLGGNYNVILRDQFAQAMRTLVNEVETDLAALYVGASRAYGTAGTAPFASDLSDPANIRKILADNGAGMGDLQLVIDTTAGAKLRTLAQLTKANEAGSAGLLNRGVLMDLHGFQIRESAKVKTHTKGTGTGYAVNLLAGYAIGATSIAADTGSNTIVAGDILTNSQSGRDANKYVVKTALTGGSVVLNDPGIRAAWVDNDTLAVGANYTANMAFARSAIHLLARVPAMPAGGDSADDVMVVTDPASGLSFQVAMYRQRRRIAYEVGLAWGVKAVKPEHIATLLG